MKLTHACCLALVLSATPIWAKCALVTYPIELRMLDGDNNAGVPKAQLTVLFADRMGAKHVDAESDRNGQARVDLTVSSADGLEPDGSDRCAFVLEKAEVYIRKEGYPDSTVRIQPLRPNVEIVIPMKKETFPPSHIP